LMDLARSNGVLEFHAVPEGNFEELKKAAMEKKKAARDRLTEKGRGTGDLWYAEMK
jgi:hypothetical protein